MSDSKNTFEIAGFHKFAEQDNWENGCSIATGRSFWVDYPLKSTTLAGLKAKILDFLGATESAMELDACDEAGRIDIQKTENNEGYDPSENELNDWKANRLDLWAVTYTCYVEQVTRRTQALVTA